MQENFNLLINSFIDFNVGIGEDFLKPELSNQLRINLKRLFDTDKMLFAGTGTEHLIQEHNIIRGDVIYWLDRSHHDQSENAFLDIIDLFVLHLNETCFTGIKSYEFHYALYNEGSFYKKHLDQFRNNDSRAYTMIIYLNEHWQQADGGELRIHHIDSMQLIAPENGRCVFFKSNELLHEVLLTHQPRMSITGWLKTS